MKLGFNYLSKLDLNLSGSFLSTIDCNCNFRKWVWLSVILLWFYSMSAAEIVYTSTISGYAYNIQYFQCFKAQLRTDD